MPQLVFTQTTPDGRSRPGHHVIQKRMLTVGTEASHDVVVASSSRGLVATLRAGEGDAGYECFPAGARVRLNGRSLHARARLQHCDRLEWAGGAAVFIDSWDSWDFRLASPRGDGGSARHSLNVLHNLASVLQSSGNWPVALHQALDAMVEMAGAEIGHLLSELGPQSAWELLASVRRDEPGGAPGEARPDCRKELFSQTILQEALRRREPVYIESIIGHPWSDAASVVAARIFSAACLPLVMGERILGAVFLISRTPGRSIRKELLPELNLLATQAALVLASQVELRNVRRENTRLRDLVQDWPSSLVFQAQGRMLEVSRKIAKLAQTPLGVLILGETGTGKEVVATELHRQSGRSKGPFIAVNCAAIPGTLLEATLFGHEKGAFTGAIRAQPGKFAQAHGGTLFLDEIGDLPLELQAKLLRVLQERAIEPLGALRPVMVDVRILAATHADLEGAVRAGRFRQDLYFRLNGAILKLPPLRERREDIAPLSAHFLREAGVTLPLSEEALGALERHPWPGNVRELKQVITRAGLLAEGPEIRTEDLDLGSSLERSGDGEARVLPLGMALEDAQLAFTRDYVSRALSENEGNRSRTAQRLGISERTLYRILAGPGPEQTA